MFVEDEPFAAQVAEMYEEDLTNATEIVLDVKNNVSDADGAPRRKHGGRLSSSGSANRAVAGAISIGGAVGAAVTNRRPLGSAESRILLAAGAILSGLVVLMYFFPRVFLYPFTAFVLWVAIVLLFRGFKLRGGGKEQAEKANSARVTAGDSTERSGSIEARKIDV